MYSSETFGRIFWVDDDYEFKSCPLNVDGTGDLTYKIMFQSGVIGRELIITNSLIFISSAYLIR